MSRGKRLASGFILLLLSVLAGFSCASLPPAPADARVVIFHFNDVHGKIDNFAKVAAIVERERQGGGDVYLFCAGDNFTGNPVIDQYQPPGEPMLELLNRLAVDLLAPGNHEFDFGMENLRNFAARARFPLVAANIEAPAGALPQLQPSIVLQTKSGLRIAVFGLIQVEAQNGLPSTHPDRVKGLRFSEPLARARAMKGLRRDGHVFLALTHLGYEDDLRLAKQMPELDVIIGGHSHTRVDPAETVNGVLVAQAGSDNRFLGRIELRLRNGRLVEKKGGLIELKGPLAENAEVKDMIARFNQNPAFARVIVEAPFAIEGRDALGSLMTDAMRAAHGLDIAFQNEGGIRLPRLPEKITLKDVYTLDPFGNQVVEIVMNAEEIRSLISDSFRRGDNIDLQVSGMAYTVRTDSERRIREIVLRGADGTPLPEDRTYRVGVSSYVASSYKFSHRDPGRALGATSADALIRFLENRPDFSIYRGVQRAFQDPPAQGRRY
ncbi:MAG: bifunctional metallophosphatase/5'-nucleotidase [Acidobacteria bacterium]|jgi:2',3'-cyclic-nucleotide 2'-phosphodiesterase (5'-nucleotidase family)|nr:bifunctional metallophosphatase/5'-nucleotidase [Acidobacteriota bacterium]